MRVKIVKLHAARAGFKVGQIFTVRRRQTADHVRRAGYFVFSPSHSQSVDQLHFLRDDEVAEVR